MRNGNQRAPAKPRSQRNSKTILALQQRDAILQAVHFAAEQLLLPVSWDASIAAVLKSLGEAANASRAYIFENHLDADGQLCSSQRYEWTRPGISSQIDNPALQNENYTKAGYQRWVMILQSDQVVAGIVRNFPASEQNTLRLEQILSILVVPIFLKGAWWGYIGFDDCVEEHEWPEADAALKTAADLIGAALERREIEEGLRQSEERYRAIVERQSELVCRVSPQFMITFANPAFCDYFGKTAAEVIGQPLLSFIAPGQIDREEQMLIEQTRNPHNDSYEISIVMPNQEVRWQQWSSSPIFDRQHQLVEIQAVGRDITEQKLAEDLVRMQRDLGIALATATTLQEGLVYLLDTATRIHGIDCGGVYLLEDDSSPVRLEVHKDLEPNLLNLIYRLPYNAAQKKSIQNGLPVYSHMRAYQPAPPQKKIDTGLRAVARLPILSEGQTIAVLTLASRTHDEVSISSRTALEAIVAQMGSVIARIKAEDALQENQKNLQNLFMSLRDLVFVTNRSGRILQTNPVFQEQLGFDQFRLRNSNLYDFIPETFHMELQRVIASAWSSGHATTRIPLIDAHSQTLMAETVFTLGRWGGQNALFAVSRDISERERMEQAERDQRILAEALCESAAALNSTLDPNTVLDRLLESVRRVVPHDAATIMLLDGDVARVVRARGYRELGIDEQVMSYRLRLDEARNMRVMIQTRKPMVIADTLHSPLWKPYPVSNWIQSYAGAPILVQDEVVGFLNLDSRTVGFFSNEDAEHLQAFADQAGVAIRNAQLYEETRQRAHQFALLSEITQAALQAISLSDMYAILANRLDELFDADSVYICMWDTVSDTPRTVAVSGSFNPDILALPLMRGEQSLTGAALEAGHALVIQNEPKGDAPLSPRIQPLLHEQTLLALPLLTAERKLGTAILGFKGERIFTASEIAVGEQAAAQIALAIFKTEVLENELQKTVQLEHTNAVIVALDRVAARIESAPNPDGVMETLGEELEKLAIQCLVTLIQPSTQTMDLYYTSVASSVQSIVDQYGFGQVRHYTFPAAVVPLFHSLIHHAQGTYVHDLMSIVDAILPSGLQARREEVLQAAQVTPQTRSISVPLKVEEQVVGLLSLWGENLHESDLPAALLFGSQVAIAFENARLYTEVQRLAVTDELAGTYNRRGLFDLGKREFERAKRFGHPLSLIMIDGDLFKEVNDTFGHPIGDVLIIELAKRLNSQIREVDILGRYGNGDEFAILLLESNAERALEAAERLRQAVEEQPIQTNAGPIAITISLGISELTADTPDLDSLFSQADQALYQAKNGGRNRVVLWTKPAGGPE